MLLLNVVIFKIFQKETSDQSDYYESELEEKYNNKIRKNYSNPEDAPATTLRRFIQKINFENVMIFKKFFSLDLKMSTLR